MNSNHLTLLCLCLQNIVTKELCQLMIVCLLVNWFAHVVCTHMNEDAIATYLPWHGTTLAEVSVVYTQLDLSQNGIKLCNFKCNSFTALTCSKLFAISERELTFTFAICYRPSICRLSVCLSSVVCNVRAPYSGGSNFRQYFYGIRYLGHPWTSTENFTEIIPGEPLRQGSLTQEG